MVRCHAGFRRETRLDRWHHQRVKSPSNLFDPLIAEVYRIRTKAPGPAGRLPLTEVELREKPSGDIFGLTQNVGMGWPPSYLDRKQFLIISTQGGLRGPDGRPIALGYHTGHFELIIQAEAAATEINKSGAIPFAVFVSDPCDGRTQGTTGMFDSLPYRNDAAIVFRRLIRSLPTRAGVLGIAACDKGLPAMIMALVGMPDLPAVIVPGGVTLPPEQGEDLGAVQTIGARFAQGQLSLEQAAELGCKACASPGGACQFLGTAATLQVTAEALGIAMPHTALAPSGQPVWIESALRSARALVELDRRGIKMRNILTQGSIRNAMAVHAAFGGSTNLLLHLPAIAHAAGLPRPRVEDWIDVNKRVPRIVDVLPNGPVGHPTVRVFLAGGVPEVMLHLRNLGLLELDVLTVTGHTLREVLESWEQSDRRSRFQELLQEHDGVLPRDVIMSPTSAATKGLASTVMFPKGNLAPEGSVLKLTAIDRALLDTEGVFRHEGPARVFTSESDAVKAVKAGQIAPGDVLVLIGCGPLGTGMEETYQLTSALKYMPFGGRVTLLTDARFSGVSTGPCIGHIGPEALAGGPIGRVRDGDVIRVVLDSKKLEGSVDLVGENGRSGTPSEGNAILASRAPHPELAPHKLLPDDTRLWAVLQHVSGGTWGGCVYDVEEIIRLLMR
ncbi:MAG: YjhG/YagF family D-xylonate dehydratase [Verrucomicrobiae bacterium]|nr:YjhG/YagF family D-xylonate dehydratase [Verrucomicrobiae bacterium]